MTQDLDIDVVRELHPPVDPAAAARPRERARAVLMAEIERARPGTRRSPWPRWRLAPAVGVLAVAAALGIAAIVAASLKGGAANPYPAAAEILQRAARAAAAGGRRALRPGEYWYVKSYDVTNGALVVAPPSVRGRIRVIVDALTTTERESWTSVDRRGLIVSRITRPITFLSDAARRQWIRWGRPPQAVGTLRITPSPDPWYPHYRQLQALPTNVDLLWRMLARYAQSGPAAEQNAKMFTEVGDLLREQPVPAKVRAALYLVAARIPGIQLRGMTRDALGRPALAVAIDDTAHGIWEELLFDPRTYALLGEAQVVVHPPRAYRVKPGAVRTGMTYATPSGSSSGSGRLVSRASAPRDRHAPGCPACGTRCPAATRPP